MIRPKIKYQGRFVISISTMLLSLIGINAGCDKPITSPSSTPTYPAGNYQEIFESFWRGMNSNYVFWSVDNTNWDDIHATYKPIFAALGPFTKHNDSIAELNFAKMTETLIDSHFTLTFVRTGLSFSPALYRKVNIHNSNQDSIYSLPLDFFTRITNTYLDQSSLKTGTDSIQVENSKTALTATSGTIKNSILYLYLNSFFLSHASDKVKPVINNFFATIANLPSSIKGIVIDVRENGGGEVNDLNYLIGSLTTSPVTYGYTQTKSDAGRFDYTPKAPAIITPQPGAVKIDKPIAVLADHLSVSLSELTVLAVKALPNGKFIGTTTWGANGPIAQSEDFNGGQFIVGDTSNPYLTVYTSSAMFEGIDGKVFEGRGISPDIWVPETVAAYQSGIDQQLEAAIKYIQNH